MPNWTSNRLSVTGEPDEVARFQSEVRGTDEQGNQVEFLFSSLVPEPDLSALSNAPANGPIDPNDVRTQGGHSWRVVRWGTKWEASDVDIEVGPERVVYRFLTAWSAPLPWVRDVSGLFPALAFELEYQDEGSDEDEQGIYIRCVFRDGELVEGNEAVERDMRVASMDPYLTEDPWLYYFFAHPEELARADQVMAGPPPDELAQWLEIKGVMDARLKETKGKVRVVDLSGSPEVDSPSDEDPEST